MQCGMGGKPEVVAGTEGGRAGRPEAPAACSAAWSASRRSLRNQRITGGRVAVIRAIWGRSPARKDTVFRLCKTLGCKALGRKKEPSRRPSDALLLLTRYSIAL